MGPPAAKMIRAGHPWVFRDSVARAPTAEPGSTVMVTDPDGRPLGRGLVEEPEGAIAVRMLTRSPDAPWDRDVIAARVDAAIAYRRAHLPDVVDHACRLVHGEGDGLPGIAVDRLGPYLLIYKYARSAESYLDDLVSVVADAVPAKGIYLQDRLRPVHPDDRRAPAFHLSGDTAPPEYEVVEDDLKFVVDVTAPVSPGLFLDLREGRRLVETLAAGRRVLNLFSFTGSFALRALRGQAAEVTNVDSAARSHARCRQNLTASGMDPEGCEALTGDAFKHLERLRTKGRRFDLAIVDPPPFSKVGNRVFSALKDWASLYAAVCAVLEPGGHALVVSNAGKLKDDELMVELGLGARAADRTTALVGERGLPADFPVPPAFGEGRYLKIKLMHVG